MQPVSIQRIAAALHIDRRYLTNLFREAYGLRPRLSDGAAPGAGPALSGPGYAVTEAASLAGFSDLSNFSRQYKRRFGQCPSARRPQDRL